MKGIWKLPVYLLGSSFKDSYALGRIIIDIISLIAITYAWSRLSSERSVINGVRYGANLLLA
jgi:hypothetical protein